MSAARTIPEQVVAVVLVKFVVLRRDDGVDEILRELGVGNGLAILDVNLAEDFVVPIDDHAGRFHLLEMGKVEGRGLLFDLLGEREEK